MRIAGRVIWFALLAFFSAAGCAAPKPYIAVVEKVGGAVGFYSEAGEELRRIPVGDFPHEAVLSPDGRLLYVSVNGVLWMTENAPGANKVAIVDTRAMEKVGEIDLGRFHRPHGVALLPDRLLLTTERPFGLIAVDLSAHRVLRDYDIRGKGPHMVTPGPRGEWAFVSNTDSDSVAAVHLASGRVELIATGAQPQGSVLSPNGDRLYVTNAGANTISIIDTRTRRIEGVIPTGRGPARIVMAPDGKTLVYNLGFEPAAGFADIPTRREVAQIKLPGRPLSLTMTRDGRRAFAGIQDQDKIIVISAPERKIERVIQLPKGSGPDPVIPLGIQ